MAARDINQNHWGNDAKPNDIEVKFNPWHDAQNGQFTHSSSGQRTGIGSGKSFASDNTPKAGGGRFGGGGAEGKWSQRELKRLKEKEKLQKDTQLFKTRTVHAAIDPENKPKPAHKTISSGGYNFEVDNADRTVRAYGTLRLQPDQIRSKSNQMTAGKPDRLSDDHGGHFIAREFGGPEIKYNHFAQNARFNMSDFRRLENSWKSEIVKGKKVKVDIIGIYEGRSKRPSWIAISFEVDGKRQRKILPNKKKGN